ncbi:hypothetical protein TELCIR_10892 [Teladorsagia circumcincta]|uniref:Uncharacterized protein n=1 Tax=Teladorsagia circumcincta TaxID=45464 RepID=A0A2G9UCA3_TELCI|nr:hypothetical protein TELCIR_10892 [Teladorsagia circumcincta]
MDRWIGMGDSDQTRSQLIDSCAERDPTRAVAVNMNALVWSCAKMARAGGRETSLCNQSKGGHLEPFQEVLLLIAAAFTLVVCMLALVHWFFVYSFVSIETRRNKLYWLVTLFPVSTSCCLIGMLAPRTSLIMTALGLLYYLMCLFVIVSLCRKNIRRLEWMVLQAPVFPSILRRFLRWFAASRNLRRTHAGTSDLVVCNFVIICEMFVLCLLATVLLAPRRNAMFDNYRRLKTSSVHDTDESELGPDDVGIEFGRRQ